MPLENKAKHDSLISENTTDSETDSEKVRMLSARSLPTSSLKEENRQVLVRVKLLSAPAV